MARVRLQDIADCLGVSRATVSLALRDDTSIPWTTREKVKETADRLGYRPDPLVSALMTYRRLGRPSAEGQLPLGMIFEFSRKDNWQRYMSPHLIKGVAQRAAQHGFRLEEFWKRDERLADAHLGHILSARNIPGVIFAPLPVTHGHRRLPWSRFASVAIGYSLAKPVLNRVTTERFHALLLAFNKLNRLGYKRFGLALHTNEDSRVHHLWVGAHLWHQEDKPEGERIPAFLQSPERWNEERFALWFKKHRPDVVLSTSFEVLSWLQNLGLSVPNDVGFLNLWVPDTNGTFSGIYHNDYQLGEAAVDLLVGMIYRNERGLPSFRQTTVLSTSWIDGKTLRQQPYTKASRRRPRSA